MTQLKQRKAEAAEQRKSAVQREKTRALAANIEARMLARLAELYTAMGY